MLMKAAIFMGSMMAAFAITSSATAHAGSIALSLVDSSGRFQVTSAKALYEGGGPSCNASPLAIFFCPRGKEPQIAVKTWGGQSYVGPMPNFIDKGHGDGQFLTSLTVNIRDNAAPGKPETFIQIYGNASDSNLVLNSIAPNRLLCGNKHGDFKCEFQDGQGFGTQTIYFGQEYAEATSLLQYTINVEAQ